MLIKSDEMEGEELEIDKLLSLAKDIRTFEGNEVLFEENDRYVFRPVLWVQISF